MPRRATPLSPEDGPHAQFALALRQLRDNAGFDAKTIHAIAAENNMPRSTLHAALRGERIPTVPVLAALVRAWGGDETEWMRRRTQVEDEIERLRLMDGRKQAHERRAGWFELRSVKTIRHRRKSVDSVSPAEACGDKIKMLKSLLDADLIDDEQYKEVLEILLKGAEPTQPARPVLPPARPKRESLSDEDPFAGIAWHELLEELKQRNDMAPTWDLLRERAGAPTIREIAGAVGVGQSAVSIVLRGRGRGNSKLLTNVFAYLVGRLESHQAQQAEDDPAAE
ncbi:helix-turn-helix domain-containing protein [Streptomyces sp. NPDC016845]|uniref:helix-turn-helix domain-containing protein n=1 Tax=Streptomyces sp. NPDC016845 TaxID=3364972 RepID=UPI00378F1663